MPNQANHSKSAPGKKKGATGALLAAGALAIGGGLFGAFQLASDDDAGSGSLDQPAPVAMLAFTQDLEAGTTGQEIIDGELYQTVTIDADEVPATPIADPTEFADQRLNREVTAGELVSAQDLVPKTTGGVLGVDIPDGHEAMAITIPFDPAVGGNAAPGDSVVIYSILNTGDGVANEDGTITGGTDPVVQTLLRDVLVLETSIDLDPEVPIDNGLRPSVGSVSYLLAVTPQQAAEIIYVQTFESLYLTLVGDEPPSDLVRVDSGDIRQDSR